MESKLVKAFRSVELLSSLSDAELGEIITLSSFCTARKGELIIESEDESDDVYFILSGTAQVANYTHSGKEVIYDDLREGAIFGELCALDGMGRSASVYAVQDVEYAKISANTFVNLVYNNPEISMGLARHLASIIRASDRQIIDTSSKSAIIRLLHLILDLARYYTDETDSVVIDNMPTHQQLSGRLGCSRETVTRILNAIEEEGLISREGRSLRVNSLSNVESRISAEES